MKNVNKQTIIAILVLFSFASITCAQGSLSGKLTTGLGETPYSIEAFNAYMEPMNGGQQYQVDFNTDGTFTVLGLPNAITDNHTLDNIGHPVDIGGADAAANINVMLPVGLTHPQAQLYNINGQILPIDETNYNPSTGKFEMFTDMSQYPNGMFLATVSDGQGRNYTTKVLNNPSGNNSKRTVSTTTLEDIARKETQQQSSLKSAPRGALAASATGTAYKLVVEDPFDNLRDTTYNDIMIFDNQVTDFEGVMKYDKKIDILLGVKRSDGEYVNNIPVVFSHTGTAADPNAINRDTVWIRNGYTITQLDPNVLGTQNISATMTNGFEYETMENPNIPFKTSTTNDIALIFGQENEIVPEVDKYQDQQIKFDCKNSTSILTGDTLRVANVPVEITYLANDGNHRVVNDFTDATGIVTLDRMPKGTEYIVRFSPGTYPTGETGELKNYFGFNGGADSFTYDLVTTESEEERTLSKVMYEVPVLADGTNVKHNEISEMCRQPSPQAATGLIRFKVSDAYFNLISRETFRARLDKVEEVFGYRPDGSKRMEYQIVEENLNPSSEDFINNYNFSTNNYKNQLTSTWGRGSPETSHKEIPLNVSTAHNKLEDINMYSIVTSNGIESSDMKEIGRNNLNQASSRSTSFMSFTGTGIPDEKDKIIAPIIFDANQWYFEGIDCTRSIKYLTEFTE